MIHELMKNKEIKLNSWELLSDVFLNIAKEEFICLIIFCVSIF